MLIARPTANNPRHEQSSATGEHAGDCGSGCPDKVAMGWLPPGERVGRTEGACWRPILDTPFDPFAGPILLLAPRAVNGSRGDRYRVVHRSSVEASVHRPGAA